MLVYAFILTFILGGFVITPTFLWVAIVIDNRNQAKKAAMRKHPSNLKVGSNPFNPTILNYENN